jgi:hypothetical protein
MARSRRPPRNQLAVSEAKWQDTILRSARLQLWLAYHTYDSRRSTPGFPDLVLVRPPRIVVAELKTEHGRLSDAQKKWLAHFEQCPGVEVHVWRPSDWKQVEEVLR